MSNLSVRIFRKNASTSAAGLAALNYVPVGASGRDRNREDLHVHIPMRVQVVIDDVAWWSGKDGSELQEPYRTGINRDHDGLYLKPQKRTVEAKGMDSC